MPKEVQAFSASVSSSHKETEDGNGGGNRANHLIAGAGAGFFSAIATCPLDVLKTRLQSRQFHYRDLGIYGSLRRIWVEEGLTGLYRGLSPTVLGLVPTWTIFFGTYERYKRMAGKICNRPADDMLPAALGSMAAGLTNNLVTNPLWVVKTRMMTLNNLEIRRADSYKPVIANNANIVYSGAAVQAARNGDDYRTTRQAFASIWRYDGWRGFYKGFAASLVGVLHVAIQFPLYEYLKQHSLQKQSHINNGNLPSKKEQAPFLSLLWSSTISKLIASVITYPHEVIRTRLHNESTPPVKYKSLLGSVKIVAREEGWRGFYRGMATNLLRTIPASAVTLLSYEWIYNLLENWV